MYEQLLKEWCDALVALQISGRGDPRLDGGILCPACKLVHGRCPDAIYPLMRMAQRTGDAAYLDAARALFAWQRNVLCDDGSVYNDPNAAWSGITVFAAVSLCEALDHHGALLGKQERSLWEERLLGMGDWLHANIHERSSTNINYLATNAAALSLLGRHFGREAYSARARELAAFAMERFTRDGLLWGEGQPWDSVTARGCRPIDIGYNVEESVPSLIKHALIQQDGDMIGTLRGISLAQLDFLLPDGGWDNSFGSRGNKWTYWGSRTSDGCAAGYALLGDDPLFAEAARRNLSLMRACTSDGLLHGGPHYARAGEPPCVHHTFTHANGLAAALAAGLAPCEETTALPCDAPLGAKHYPELDTWKIGVGGMRATVTGYDSTLAGGHISGGTMSLLWHEKTGPLLAASVMDYRLVETLNMQLPLKKARHRPLVARVEMRREGERYAQCFDTGASIRVREGEGVIEAIVEASLVASDQRRPPRDAHCSLLYRISPDAVTITGTLRGDCDGACFVLPVIAPGARVTTSPPAAPPEDIFFLTGGFTAREFTIQPDAQGNFRVEIAV